MLTKKCSFFYAIFALLIIISGCLALPAQAIEQDIVSPGLKKIGTIDMDTTQINTTDTWSKGEDKLQAFATKEGITLLNLETKYEKQFPLPVNEGPGRDIFPWVIIPWQISFSPNGQNILLITMEGYEDQGADYFRLWVLNLEGQVEACTHGNGINQAAWIDDQQIFYIDYKDPSLRMGDIWVWNWQATNS